MRLKDIRTGYVYALTYTSGIRPSSSVPRCYALAAGEETVKVTRWNGYTSTKVLQKQIRFEPVEAPDGLLSIYRTQTRTGASVIEKVCPLDEWPAWAAKAAAERSARREEAVAALAACHQRRDRLQRALLAHFPLPFDLSPAINIAMHVDELGGAEVTVRLADILEAAAGAAPPDTLAEVERAGEMIAAVRRAAAKHFPGQQAKP